MADVYLERSDLEICKDDVKTSTDIAELTAWLDEQNEVSQEIAIMLGAMKFAPHADTERMARKLGYVNMSKAWIQKRLKQLGIDDERVVPNTGKMAHIQMLTKHLQEKNATIKAQNIELTALRQELARFKRAEVKAA